MVADALPLLTRQLGLADYESTWHAMQTFTDARTTDTPDEIWLLEHPPVFTLGQAGKPEHILQRGDIPIVKIDRGGQVTYHGPGQLIAYTLLDLRRLGIGVRELVRRLENSVIALLADYDIEAYGKVDAPGVYIRDDLGEAKIAALGLRIRNGCCFHGLSLNVNMDLGPFDMINPCGYEGLRVAQLADFGVSETPASIAGKMADKILQQIN
ncbi:lipoyl(octanoyl) transferase LipB [Andreprevotia chitinilytica]|uniref:lipoyl(octanoyl) transferase LipB n=1 Tax=Andreprevotia chitinilytica TaxID=396808 RepID=UPI000550E906|nr:lipoyl(octanoyl) transferase LipB [Andreprevotia chitinilytica]